MISDDKLLVTPTEAARLLGIGRTTVYQLMHMADFPIVKINSRSLIPVDGLRAWVTEHTNLSSHPVD